MQENTIVIPVDVLNNGSAVNQSFVRSEEQLNRTTYRGPGHSLISRNVMQFYRTPPKRVADDFGTAKSSVKFTRDITVPAGTTSVVKPLIIEVNFSTPVGTSNADMLALRQHVVALLDTDSIMVPLVSVQEI